MCPIGHGSQCCPAFEGIPFIEQRHQSNKASIAASIDTDPVGINAMLCHEIFGAVDLIGKVFSTHMPIDSGSPIPAIAGSASIVNVQHSITQVGQKVVKHVFPKIG